VLEIEVIGAGEVPGAPPAAETERLAALALASAGVVDGHLAIHYVDAEHIARLNDEHRAVPGPTDVLSFPVDGAQAGVPEGARELGDVVICAAHTRDLREAIVHGILHLVGMDHETDDGEMLAVQAEILSW
jgi:probable rRNA maturation factor